MKIDDQTNPQDLAKHLQEIPPQVLNQLNHALLYQAREYVKGAESQAKLAAPEHRAFAREATAENPLMALPIAAGTLAYQPYKMLKGQSRSGASLEQVGAGMAGIGEGISQYTATKMEAFQQLLSKL